MISNKICADFDEAISDIPDGAIIGIDSWAVSATPQNLIAAIKRKGIKDLTIVTHCLIPMIFGEEQAIMVSALLPQMKKVIAAVVGIQHLGAGTFVEEYERNGLEVELTTMGTLTSRLYAGVHGIGGFYNPVGVGTILEKGKEKRVIDGREYLFEKPIRLDYALIAAHKADTMGNLVYKGIFRGDHPMMTMAANFTIAEVDEIVEAGAINAENIITQGIFVDRIIQIPQDGLGTTQKLKELIRILGDIEPARKLMFKERATTGR